MYTQALSPTKSLNKLSYGANIILFLRSTVIYIKSENTANLMH